MEWPEWLLLILCSSLGQIDILLFSKSENSEAAFLCPVHFRLPDAAGSGVHDRLHGSHPEQHRRPRRLHASVAHHGSHTRRDLRLRRRG